MKNDKRAMASYLLDYQTGGSPDTVTFLRAPSNASTHTDTDFVAPHERTTRKRPMPLLQGELATAHDVIGIAMVMLAIGFCLGYYFGFTR